MQYQLLYEYNRMTAMNYNDDDDDIDNNNNNNYYYYYYEYNRTAQIPNKTSPETLHLTRAWDRLQTQVSTFCLCVTRKVLCLPTSGRRLVLPWVLQVIKEKVLVLGPDFGFEGQVLCRKS